MIIGRLICEKCGRDCTSLYGFALMSRGTIRNRQTREALDAVKKRFGKEEFVWCWECTAEAFGARPLPVKPAEPEPEKTTTSNVATEPETETAEVKGDG